MAATIKSHDLNEVAARLVALASVDQGRADLAFTAAEVDLVIAHRRAGHEAWLSARGINVVRMAPQEAPKVDASALPIPHAEAAQEQSVE